MQGEILVVDDDVDTAEVNGGNGDETFAINVNCLDDVDVATLKLTPFDGKNM